MKFLNKADIRLVEISDIELINIERACKNVDPKATTYTAVFHLIEAFSQIPQPLAVRLYKDIMEMSGNFGGIIQKTAEERKISFGEAKYYLNTGVMPEKGKELND